MPTATIPSRATASSRAATRSRFGPLSTFCPAIQRPQKSPPADRRNWISLCRVPIRSSSPIDDKTKWDLFRDCSRCHTLRRPAMSTYDAEELSWVLMRMVYSAGSSPMRFQLPANLAPHWGRTEGGEPSALQKRQADAVASINLRSGMWPYELKTMPRPKGKETEVVYTTWDLPATARPHDT